MHVDLSSGLGKAGARQQLEDKTSIGHQNSSKHADVVYTYIGSHT